VETADSEGGVGADEDDADSEVEVDEERGSEWI